MEIVHEGDTLSGQLRRWEAEYRFMCDCHDAAHYLVLSADDHASGMVDWTEKYIPQAGGYPLKLRLKHAWDMLRGRPVWTHGVIIQPSDYANLLYAVMQITDRLQAQLKGGEK